MKMRETEMGTQPLERHIFPSRSNPGCSTHTGDLPRSWRSRSDTMLGRGQGLMWATATGGMKGLGLRVRTPGKGQGTAQTRTRTPTGVTMPMSRVSVAVPVISTAAPCREPRAESAPLGRIRPMHRWGCY